MAELTLTVDGPTATLTLQRPQVRNALSSRLIAEMTAALGTLPSSVRVLVLQGEGAVFCAGADLQDMQRSCDLDAAANRLEAEALAELFYRLDSLPQVVVGRVQGAALGGAMGLCACCDVVVAEAGARFGFTEVRLGLVPAVIAPCVLRKLGMGACRQLFLTGALFAAAEALRLGLVHQVVAADDLQATVDGVVAGLLKNGPLALRAAKKLLADLPELAAPAARALTTELIATLRVSPEGQEGLAAFFERRPPRWVP
jgi:methylglutaconyl-CoA hydratase